MRTTLLPVLCCCLLRPSASPAADTNPPPRVTVELRDGSRVVGTSTGNTLHFHSALLGDLKLAVTDIRTIEWAGTNALKLKAANGDILALQSADSTIPLQSGFGKLNLKFDSIRKLSVAASSVIPPQREGLIAFWSGNGDATDSTGNYTGTLAGGAGYGPGLTGQAFNFESPGSFVRAPKSPAFDPGSEVTIEFWLKPGADNVMQHYQGLVTSDFYGVEISNGYGGPMGVNFFLNTSANHAPTMNDGFMSRAIGTGYYTEISDANGGGAPISPGAWHHVAATYDGRYLRLYIDGALWRNAVAHRGRITPMLAESFLTIGSEDGRTASPDCISNRYFKGQIANVALYKRALTPSEISEDFEAQKPD